VDTFFLSTPIFYVNAKPHLGHAYTTIVADTVTRFHKLMGRETFFLTGTDEHGDKIAQAAAKNAQSPKQYVDAISEMFKVMGPQLCAEPNRFIRTTDKDHVETVRGILQKVYDAGDIYFGEYGGHYCYGCERFYTEKELEDGKCPQHGVEPEYIAEKNYFFRMSKYQDWLAEHIRKNPDFIRPERYRNEVLSLLESGALEDLCISRPKTRLKWGIELPFDQDYVCYVWFDALINYVSALGWPDGAKFKKFWPGANHLIAKDILKPHAVFWPTMLKAAGIEPYQHLNVHGYWLVQDTKMSKSLGNVVEPMDMIGTYGVNAFRYFLMREMSFGNDASFSEEALVGRLNADLANDLGNLFSRTLAMTHKYCGGKVPAPDQLEEIEDAEIKKRGQNAMAAYQEHFTAFRFARGLESLWELVRGLNKYIDTVKPWDLNKKGDTKRLSTVIYIMLENMRKIAVHLWPVMPGSAVEMLRQLGIEFEPSKISLEKELDAWGLLDVGAEVAESSNLFPRVDPPASAASEAGAGSVKKAPAAQNGKGAKNGKAAKDAVEPGLPGFVEFEDFQKLDLRVGTVVNVERHPDADRLLLVRVDIGEDEPRQVVAGLAEFFTPEDLAGRQVVMVANLKPRKLRKQVSQGMILAVKKDDGMELLSASGPVAPGAKVS
jgi:methionyl-tRNA synthetase